MQVAVLGSGSRGNATLISGPQGAVLLDCGFSRRQLEQRLDAAGVTPEQLVAILVTHEHSDHIGGVARASRAWNLPVYATHGTARTGKLEGCAALHEIHPHQNLQLAGLDIQSYPVPHDAAEPVQFLFREESRRLGVLSDAGHVTAHMRLMLDGCDALLLEFNHCPEMLERGPYPAALQARVGGRFGHLSNQQAAELLGALDLDRTQRVVMTHLSEKNNSPERATTVARNQLGAWAGELCVAAQDDVMSTFSV